MSIHLMPVSFKPAAFIPHTFAGTAGRAILPSRAATAQAPAKTREYRIRLAAERLIELPISAAALAGSAGKATRH